MMKSNMRYTYGTGEVAAERLEGIAKFFNPLSYEFICRFVKGAITSAVDLGCGPGFTTNMLYNALECSHVYGIDTSPHFLALAAQKFKHCTFIEHDVTVVPFPVQADVMYVRFLLSHCGDAIALVNRWTTQLPAKGKLLIEELESIDTVVPAFKEYLEINSALIASQGASLYVGSPLGSSLYEATLLCNECIAMSVVNYQAATWFYPNTISIWEQEQYVLDRVSPLRRKNISKEILKIKESRDPAMDSTWKIRRLVLECH
jgi:SAM-dependent methyltransferase